MRIKQSTYLLPILPLIVLLMSLLFIGQVYATTCSESGGGEVQWGHLYPPSGGTYHYHTIGYFAWVTRWENSFPWHGDGEIYMGGSEGTTSWYCGGQQWWSQPATIMYKIEVIKIKDLTNQTVFTDPNILHNSVQFYDCWIRPQGSTYTDEILNMLWDIVQLASQFTWPNPFKFLSSVTSIQGGWGEVTAYGSGNLSEFETLVKLWTVIGLNSTHTYEITCKLTWRASFYIFVEDGLQGINPIKLENINPLQTGQPVGTAYAYTYEYITFKVTSS